MPRAALAILWPLAQEQDTNKLSSAEGVESGAESLEF